MERTLTVVCHEEFLANDRKKGIELFAAGDVDIIEAGHRGILANVTGTSSTYAVAIDLADVDEGGLGIFCDCPRFDDMGCCKHLWATILEVDRCYDMSSLLDEDFDFYECDPYDIDVGIRLARRPAEPRTSIATVKPAVTSKAWQKKLNVLFQAYPNQQTIVPRSVPSLKGTRYWFSLALNQTLSDPLFSIRVHSSEVKSDGTWTVPMSRRGVDEVFSARMDYESRKLLSLLRVERSRAEYSYQDPVIKLRLPGDRLEEALKSLTESGRFVWTMDSTSTLEDYRTLTFDEGGSWHLRLNISQSKAKTILVAPFLHRVKTSGEVEQRSVDQIVSVCDSGAILFENQIGILQKIDTGPTRGWQRISNLEIPASDFSDLMSELVNAPTLPEIDWDKSLAINRLETKPKGKLVLEYPDFAHDTSLKANISFLYDQFVVDADNGNKLDWDSENRRLIVRDMEAESKLLLPLSQFAFQESIYSFSGRQYVIHRKWLPDLVKKLSEIDWEVVVGGKKIRNCSSLSLKVQSGQDWFDVDANIDFGGMSTNLPELLKAVKQGKKFIVLDDGSEGMLPEEWLKRLDRLSQLGQADENGLRFQPNQALMLDMLLSEQVNVTVDKNFSSICAKLKNFSGIAPADQPRSFQGEMREYQREGLGWFGFLREFGFGGCLADDMGLGKTIQVLALLEQRRTRRLKKDETRKPSIAIVPKSLIFNWIDEAKRFAPKLKIVDYTGVDRSDRFGQIADCDLILTTYATFRLDIEKLQDIEFDYAILDEAQAVKNPSSLASKAVRLIKSEQRLAMTGTPVENHLGDLWSLFEFLNPGMLGRSLANTFTAKGDDQQERLSSLNQALKPFILRRTKEQVLTELPAKTEQTLFCEMSPKQKKLYNELRDHYRASLDKTIQSVGIKRSKIQVLEALLRLRQTACDPRLIDASQKTVGSKIELLTEQVAELIDEGHKVLIFSQFTSLLSLVKKELDKRNWKYEYLDGASNRRGESVKRFQEDPNCPLFLISLKAGGHGLNLTAADYVFIMDPWWNPAVEAQAVDRAHRMGQQNHVVAYRMITKGTVEEKIVELQKSKRELADAIISADQSLIQSLSMDDLRVLFE